MPRPPLNSLIPSNNFNTWFLRTNDIINEVNFLNTIGITGITGSNGIGVTFDSERNYTVRFTGDVSGSVTFSGPVSFLNTISASSINVSSTKLSYSPKVSGLTAGNVVRIDSTVGLTFAMANNSDNAEVIGIIVGEDASYNYIAVSGQIDNSTFSNTIRNSLGIVGGTLGKGTAYFLSPTVAGGITTIEPSAYGQVSKPLLLGITGDKGLILPYRGIVIEGISAGITAELDNKIIISIDYSTLNAIPGFTNGANRSSPTAIKIGDPVFFASNGDSVGWFSGNPDPVTLLTNLAGVPTDASAANNCAVKLAGLDYTGELAYWIVDWANSAAGFNSDTNNYWKYFMGNRIVEDKSILGLVSGIVATPASLGTSKYILEITLPGGTIQVDDFTTDVDTTLYPVVPTDYGSGLLAGLSTGTYLWCPQMLQNQSTHINPYTNDGADWDNGWYRLFHESILFLGGFSTKTYIEKYPFVQIFKDSATSGKIVFRYDTNRQFVATEQSGEDQIGSSLTLLSGSGVGSGVTSATAYNYLPNGAFTVWQRTFTGYSGATSGSFNYDYLIPIADRWYFTNNTNLSGLTLDLQRREFDSNQTTVLGSPLYYVDVKTQYGSVGITYEWRPRLENIQKGARLLQGQTATVSFYAKSTVSGATVDLVFNRYSEGITLSSSFETTLNTRTSVVAGISLSTSWAKYSQSFIVPTMGTTLTTEQDGWVAFGFEFPSSTATVSLAQVVLEPNYGSNTIIHVDREQELNRCKPYYQRSYDLDEIPQSTNFRGNEEAIMLGNMNSQIVYPIKFPIKMIESPANVTIYSPSTGTPTEAYNVNAGQDLRYTTGTLIGYPWDVTPQYRLGAGLTGNVTIPDMSKHGFDIQINSGAVSFDTIKFHWIADADLLYRT